MDLYSPPVNSRLSTEFPNRLVSPPVNSKLRINVPSRLVFSTRESLGENVGSKSDMYSLRIGIPQGLHRDFTGIAEASQKQIANEGTATFSAREM